MFSTSSTTPSWLASSCWCCWPSSPPWATTPPPMIQRVGLLAKTQVSIINVLAKVGQWTHMMCHNPSFRLKIFNKNTSHILMWNWLNTSLVVTTPTQLYSKLDLTGKWLCTPLPTPTTITYNPPPQTQCQQYLSCYWPDFDQTLKVGFLGSTTTTATQQQQQQQQWQNLIY